MNSVPAITICVQRSENVSKFIRKQSFVSIILIIGWPTSF